MGILDQKKRILDTIITEEGRRQLGAGEFQIKFVAFSDKSTFYEADLVSGSTDANERVYFEAISLPQDRITFEADDSGKLMPFQTDGNIGLTAGKIVSGSSTQTKQFVTGTQFASIAGQLISGSAENFCKMRVIGSKDLFFDTENFTLNKNRLDYTITDQNPIPTSDVQNISVDDVESLFQDKRLSHIPNFQFLPPRNKPSTQEPDGSSLGNFTAINQESFAPFPAGTQQEKNPRHEFRVLKQQLTGLEVETIEFTETSRPNNLFGQFFEIRNKDVLKLDVIDFGTFPSEDPAFPDPHVFFVGKVFIDSVGRHTFVNMFTLVFE